MTTPSSESTKSDSSSSADAEVEEHFRPTGTIYILAAFVVALILLWLSVYFILLSRGVTA